ncbi:putative Shwachman-Bodian-diamond syndrome protein [Leucosporidium creatinivorum]|uniref:Putative Shwachman-Bodian-diamond syndrome protein n=1 Tax=Leucosporidium creatinivorum TaxID=106004 RepID=A0A1Y2C7H8_9BASI|nr:putative Shwachman-Bodian-diamond syndrome protein [Leucosporidium creatinivorum]
MSAGKQPGTQIKLTNVSIVRLKKGGKRFEIACYKNTVKAYRSGAQTDLSEVIQIDNVFTNVTKGAVAPTADLQKAFGTTDIQTVLLEVLKKGELQVGEKERAVELEEMRREIATEVAGRCVDPGTQRPHTVGMIEKAMNELGYSVNLSKAAKVQALDLIKKLQESNTLPIARARMRVRITMPSKDGKRIKDKVLPLVAKVEDDDWADEWELVGLIDPGSFKLIDEMLQKEVKNGKAKVETMSFSVVEGESVIE